jgi:uncharacterized protein YbjT (DUF2867 family)
MASALVIGSTGLVGNEVLKTLIASPAFTTLHTICRRDPKQTSPKLHNVIEADNSKWAASLKALSPPPSAVLAALGTTKSQAGSVEGQWKIDHDLNIELAKAAKEAGVRTYVFVSSAGTRGLLSGFSTLPYAKMKVGVEDAVMGMGFDNVVIMRPAMILGEREAQKAQKGGAAFVSVVNGLGRVSGALRDVLGQDAEVIARAAVHAARIAGEGKAPKNPWILESADIVKYGRDEWKE